MIYDKNFLLQLDKTKNKIIYARITALTFDERPIETIEGRITQGSINVDGASAVRRTCSLTMVADDFNYQNYYWGINTKFKLEIGVQNFINSNYPDIIWFKQGIYLFTSFNTSRSTNNFTISLQGKDKMCLLNGEVGGSLESQIDFGTIQERTLDGILSITKIPIKDIIRNAVHVYAQEPYHNIIIKDLDMQGLELLEYRYDTPMYLYKDGKNNNNYNQMTLDGETKCSVINRTTEKPITKLSELTSNELDMLISPLSGTNNPALIKIKHGNQEIETYIAKIEYGQSAGYRMTELTFAGDLIVNVGESICSMLDKIRNMLNEYEYFYNVDGQFVFQKKESFINTLWTPIHKSETMTDGIFHSDMYVESLIDSSSIAYTFNEGELITAFSNNPNILNMRNDYSIWGTKKTLSGGEKLVHMRYAIDNKPFIYKTINIENDDPQIVAYNKKYNTNLTGQISTEYNIDKYDWREIIYQMAIDYHKYNILDDFESRVEAANIISNEWGEIIGSAYPGGRTGYERYYTDMIRFWREIYDPSIPTDEFYNENNINKYWNKNVYENPHLLDFWLDFLDTEGTLSKFNTKNVGFRTKSINDNNIKAIYFRETPEVIFYNDNEKIDQSNTAYKYIQIPDIENMFSISSQGKSAKNKLDELIYQHCYCIESATITTIPVYYLQPNTRIHLFDSETGLNGDYIINKITIPLAYNGTMQISATKAAERII